jgi:hypothetical protein
LVCMFLVFLIKLSILTSAYCNLILLIRYEMLLSVACLCDTVTVTYTNLISYHNWEVYYSLLMF